MRRCVVVLLLVLASSAVGKPATKGAPKKKPPVAAPAMTPPPVEPQPAPEPAPAPAPHVFTVGVMPFVAVSITPEQASLYTEVVAQQLTSRGVKVMTNADMTAVLGLERQKQLMGCTESNCAAELAGALGFDALVTGTVGKVEGRYSLSVKLLNPTNATTLGTYSQQGLTPRALEAALLRAAWELANQLSTLPGHEALKPADLAPVVAIEQPQATASLRPFALIPAVLAVAGGVVGGVFYSQAMDKLNAMDPSKISLQEARNYAADGKALERNAWISFGIGGACLVTAVLMFALGDAGGPAPIAWFDAHGGGFAVTGRWP
jgi:TolB-like protein